jgi:hypothetical protein
MELAQLQISVEKRGIPQYEYVDPVQEVFLFYLQNEADKRELYFASL